MNWGGLLGRERRLTQDVCPGLAIGERPRRDCTGFGVFDEVGTIRPDRVGGAGGVRTGQQRAVHVDTERALVDRGNAFTDHLAQTTANRACDDGFSQHPPYSSQQLRNRSVQRDRWHELKLLLHLPVYLTNQAFGLPRRDGFDVFDDLRHKRRKQSLFDATWR
jgi:hypothetical protein